VFVHFLDSFAVDGVDVLRAFRDFTGTICGFSTQDGLTAAELIRCALRLLGYRYFFVRRRTEFQEFG